MIDQPRPGPVPALSRPGLWGVAAAIVAVLLSLRVLATADPTAGFRAPDLLSYLLTGLGAGAVGWARHRPLPALAIAATTATVLSFRDDHVDVLPFVVTVILFAV